jgi:dTDP-4-amino-4,6-dideoxygalactose transaminase
MEAFRSLVRGDLSPAGNKISLVRNSKEFGYTIDGYHANWVDSGTSALALALLDAKKAQSIVNPKVIIPGYCCPDLVAAAVYAGVKPLVVDICVNDASYDLDALNTSLADENVIAVIAVNFLGVKERLAEIKKIIAHKPVKIIEDNAQWFPASIDQHQFIGDYVLFSFGRGKPLSLLGGGALFSKTPLLVSDVILQDKPNATKQILKTRLYNILLNPLFYCYLNRAPFLQLGETRYHQHEKITALGPFQKSVFNHNLLRYEQRHIEIEQEYEKLFTLVDLQDLSSLATQRRMRLLRFPLLCKSSGQRDEILELLSSQGLGASPLYQRAIIEIPMVPELVEVLGDLPNARQFARRFLTLPTHQYVNHQHISRIKASFLSLRSRA